MIENVTKPTLVSVEGFIGEIENPRRRMDALTALGIYKKITELAPVMWGPSIIGFGTHNYKYDSGGEGAVPTASYSPRKANIVFYIGDGFEGANSLLAALGKHKKSVGCLYINNLDDVDLEVLRIIIARDFAAPRDELN